MSQKRTRLSGVDSGGRNVIPQVPVNRFLEYVETRAWTDAEKELDIIRQKSDNSQWSRGYVKALEGLMLTYRNDDDKYIYLPKTLTNKSGPENEALRKEFEEFAANEIHGEYDRGFFKALEDYLSQVATLRPAQESAEQEKTTTEAVQQKLT